VGMDQVPPCGHIETEALPDLVDAGQDAAPGSSECSVP
jgi:hypothetical protein